MLSFRPRTPGLEPLSKASVAAWAAQTSGMPRLDHGARCTLATLVHAIVVHEARPEPWADDPFGAGVEIEWEPEWRPAPGYELVPLLIDDLGWALEWTTPVVDAERNALGDDEDRYERGPSILSLDEEEATSESDEGRLVVRDGAVDLEWWEDMDAADPDVLIHTVQGLTGWVALSPGEGVIEFEPVRCAGCGHETETQRLYDGRCPACGGRRLSLAPGEPVEDEVMMPVRVAARRLISLLVEAEALELRSASSRVEDAFCAVVAHPERADGLGPALMDLDEVEEVHVDDETLARLVRAW